MSLTDANGLAVTTTSRAALEHLDRAGQLFARFRADPMAEIDAALGEAPDFAMAHLVRAALLLSATEEGLEAEARKSIDAAAAQAPRLNERERAHLAAASAWASRDLDRAWELYGAIVASWPRDLFALQIAHQLDFFLGRRETLRNRPAAALTAWREGEPGFGFILGMQAFGQEECGEYAAAEDSGRWAVALEPADSWAIHAVAHVMEMQGRTEEGVAWLARREADWAPENLLACHNWWHRALFHLDRGEVAETLTLYDRGVRPGRAGGAQPSPALELVDASAMLWRLHLVGVDPGAARWAEVSDAWAATLGAQSYYAFNDTHGIMAHLGAGRREAAAGTAAALERAAAAAQTAGTNAELARDVGLPFARALMAFDRGAYAEAAALLAPLRPIAHRFGGSHAQRDIIALTLAESLLRAGETGAARAMAEKRLEVKPESMFARRLAAGAAAAVRTGAAA
jgi:hypothetical protein